MNVGSVYGTANVMAARNNMPTGSKPNVRLANYEKKTQSLNIFLNMVRCHTLSTHELPLKPRRILY